MLVRSFEDDKRRVALTLTTTERLTTRPNPAESKAVFSTVVDDTSKLHHLVPTCARMSGGRPELSLL